MPDIRKPPPPENEKTCGSCRSYQLIMPEEFHYPWSGPFVCKNTKVNPDHKDPRDGKGMFYDRKPCDFWEW